MRITSSTKGTFRNKGFCVAKEMQVDIIFHNFKTLFYNGSLSRKEVPRKYPLFPYSQTNRICYIKGAKILRKER